MRATEMIVICQNCNNEFELFSDDGANDTTVIWNWCPHCGAKSQVWARFKGPIEIVYLGLTAEEALKKFGKQPPEKGKSGGALPEEDPLNSCELRDTCDACFTMDKHRCKKWLNTQSEKADLMKEFEPITDNH